MTCLQIFAYRGAKNRRGYKPEMPCQLPSNDDLIEFIKNFNTDVMPCIQYMLNEYKPKVVTFHSHKEADDYIDDIRTVY